MLKSYPAIFHKEEDSYWVEFPEFSGGTEGDNIEEAMVNAHQMLESVLQSPNGWLDFVIAKISIIPKF